jgi:Abnormal spindle-like microcephaly-assoc'd, ASPM-SPD-2-Hydin
MRFFPRVLAACLLCWLAPLYVSAQQLKCEPCNYNFGKVQMGGSGSYSIELLNTGRKVLRITSKSKQGSAFSFGKFPLPVKLRPGASIQLPIVFIPSAKGRSNGVFKLVSTAKNAQLIVGASGFGIADGNAQLGVSPASLNFGNVTVGSTASLSATLVASNGPVTISADDSSSSEFAIVGLNLPLTLAAGQSMPVTIQFTPNSSGADPSQATFISNAVDSPTVEQLTGTGVAPNSHYVDLAWDPGDGNAVGYNVYRGAVQGGPYQVINTALDASTNYTDSTVVSGATYYYVTTEVNEQGQESPYSNVAKAVIPNQQSRTD